MLSGLVNQTRVSDVKAPCSPRQHPSFLRSVPIGPECGQGKSNEEAVQPQDGRPDSRSSGSRGSRRDSSGHPSSRGADSALPLKLVATCRCRGEQPLRLHEPRPDDEPALDRAHGRRPAARRRLPHAQGREDDPRAGRPRRDRRAALGRVYASATDARQVLTIDAAPARARAPRRRVPGRTRVRPGRAPRLRLRRKRRRGDRLQRGRPPDRDGPARRRGRQRPVRPRRARCSSTSRRATISR